MGNEASAELPAPAPKNDATKDDRFSEIERLRDQRRSKIRREVSRLCADVESSSQKEKWQESFLQLRDFSVREGIVKPVDLKGQSHRSLCKLSRGYLLRKSACCPEDAQDCKPWEKGPCCQAQPCSNKAVVALDLTQTNMMGQLAPLKPLLGAGTVRKLELELTGRYCCFYCKTHAQRLDEDQKVMAFNWMGGMASNSVYYLNNWDRLLDVMYRDVSVLRRDKHGYPTQAKWGERRSHPDTLLRIFLLGVVDMTGFVGTKVRPSFQMLKDSIQIGWRGALKQLVFGWFGVIVGSLERLKMLAAFYYLLMSNEEFLEHLGSGSDSSSSSKTRVVDALRGGFYDMLGYVARSLPFSTTSLQARIPQMATASLRYAAKTLAAPTAATAAAAAAQSCSCSTACSDQGWCYVDASAKDACRKAFVPLHDGWRGSWSWCRADRPVKDADGAAGGAWTF